MNDLSKSNGHTEITPEDKVLNAHQYLLDFLDKFEAAKRGGIHDFMELVMFNMIQTAIKNIDGCLQKGNTSVNGNEIMTIVADSYQKVLDGVKRNIESLKEVKFK